MKKHVVRKIKVSIVILVLFSLPSIYLLMLLFPNNQSPVRSIHYSRMSELHALVLQYHEQTGKYPTTYQQLVGADLMKPDEAEKFEQFKLMGGAGGLIAFQRSLCRAVSAGEEYGSFGDVAEDDLPAIRFVLLVRGDSAKLYEKDLKQWIGAPLMMPETIFLSEYSWLLFDAKPPGRPQSEAMSPDSNLAQGNLDDPHMPKDWRLLLA